MGTWFESAGVGTVAAAIITVVWKPWSDEAKDRRDADKMVKLYNRGSPAVKGLFAALPTAAERMQSAEKDIDDLQELVAARIAETTELRRVNDLRWQQNDEALRKIHRAITNLTGAFAQFVNSNKKNGGDGPGFGDSLLRIERGLGVSPLAEEEDDDDTPGSA